MKKKITVITILVLLIGFFSFNFISVKADSGWDSDYDFGDSDWGSDWGSSWDDDDDYDWDWDYDSSSHSSRSHGSTHYTLSPLKDLLYYFLFLALLSAIPITIFILANKRGTKRPKSVRYQGNSDLANTITDEAIKMVIPNFDKDEFLNKAYQTFIDVQNAWSEFDYDKLRSLLTDELFNTYHSQLIALSAKKQKNVMENFEKIKMDITRVSVKKDKIALTVALVIRFNDYIVNENGTVVRGSRLYKLQNSYDLTFISTLGEKKKTKTCPSCGAKLENESSNICPYCKSHVVFKDHDWLLSKKEIRRY